MKLMYCQACGDIVCPPRTAKQYKHCLCRRHAVWWRDPAAGLLSVYDSWRDGSNEWRPAAFVLGMTNSWLQHRSENLTKEDYKEIIDEHPDTYLFKTLETVAVRIRPGMSSDTMWEDLPKDVIIGLQGVQMQSGVNLS
jgi:hypothetical protein